MHKISILVTNTTTILGRCIRKILGGRYNHVSLVLDDDYSRLYAFSRRYRQLWFTGCFCIETIKGIACSNYLDGVVAEIEVSDEQYDNLILFLSHLDSHFRIYNYIDAILIPLNKGLDLENHYVCSTFISKILDDYTDINLSKDYYLYKPMDVYNLIEDYIVYRGDIRSYDN